MIRLTSSPLRLVPLILAAATAAPVAADEGYRPFTLIGEADDGWAQMTPERMPEPHLTAPFFSEDALITTDIRPYFLYHDFPKSSPIGGGNVKAVAAQVRVAVTDSVQFVAYKDGYMDFDSGLIEDEGFFDIAAGLKWAFIQDYDNDFHVAVGAGYELAIGDDEVLQDDDELRLFIAANKGFGPLHFSGTFNYFFALDDDDDAFGDSDHLSWHLHADYAVTDWLAPVVELNGYHVTDEGDPVTPFSGVDVANLGGNESEDVVTYGVGVALRPTSRLSIRTAYEAPLTNNEDLFGYRWTTSLIFRF
jgi:hypothetical protein